MIKSLALGLALSLSGLALVSVSPTSEVAQAAYLPIKADLPSGPIDLDKVRKEGPKGLVKASDGAYVSKAYASRHEEVLATYVNPKPVIPSTINDPVQVTEGPKVPKAKTSTKTSPTTPQTTTTTPNDPWVAQTLSDAGLSQIPVTVTDDPTLNCGSRMSPGGTGGGCTHNGTTVYISPTTVGTGAGTHVLLHEYAHTLGMGECAAEKFAQDRMSVKYVSYPQCG